MKVVFRIVYRMYGHDSTTMELNTRVMNQLHRTGSDAPDDPSQWVMYDYFTQILGL